MATYKEIHGVKVQYRDSDATAVEGDVWYNRSTGKLKMYITAGAWSSGGTINQGKQVSFSVGTQTAAMAAAGYASGPIVTAEQYDGSSWTEVADLNQGRGGIHGGAGTQTAAIVAGGDQYPGDRQTSYSETWDNSSWTATPALNTVRANSGMFGATNTAAIIASGDTTPNHAATVNVESWDGSSWTEIANVNTHRNVLQGTGTSTAGMVIGGDDLTPTIQKLVEEWNGTSWTETTDLATPRKQAGCSRGSNTSIVIFGGRTGSPAVLFANTESWDGSSWSEVADLATDRDNVGGAGSGNTSALCWGPAPTTATEEFSFATSAETVAFD